MKWVAGRRAAERRIVCVCVCVLERGAWPTTEGGRGCYGGRCGGRPAWCRRRPDLGEAPEDNGDPDGGEVVVQAVKVGALLVHLYHT